MTQTTFQALQFTNNSTQDFKSYFVPIKNYLSAKFICTGSNTNLATNTAVVNNNILLQPYICSQLQIAENPYCIEINNNKDEITTTQITLKVPQNVIVTIIFKFKASF
jgi:hypothetical protein